MLTVEDSRFLMNGDPFDMWGVRVASASQTDALTDSLIENLDEYKAHRVNTITLFVQGSSAGFSDPFTPDGKSIDTDHLGRIKRIVEACDIRGMVAVVGVFYQRAMSNTDNVRSLDSPDAVIEAIRTVTRELRAYDNVIINVANEQNSAIYRKMIGNAAMLYNFNDPQRIIELCRVVHETDAKRLVGAGGYQDDANVAIGRSPNVDILLFDTYGEDVSNDQDSGWHYDHFVENGVVGKPIVNVEIFGGWTKRFVTESGEAGRFPEAGRETHFREISAACKRPGLSVFLHSNPWYQGPSIGQPVHFDLGGAGTSEDPGVRWYFEHIRDGDSDLEEAPLPSDEQ